MSEENSTSIQKDTLSPKQSKHSSRFTVKKSKRLKLSGKPKKIRLPDQLGEYWRNKHRSPKVITSSTDDLTKENSPAVNSDVRKDVNPLNPIEINDSMTMEAENYELIVEPSNPSQDIPIFKLGGRRLIEIDYFIDQIQSMDKHESLECGFKYMHPIREIRRGLNSTIVFRCEMSNFEKSADTNKIYKPKDKDCMMDVNTAAMSGTMSTGGGLAQLEEMMSTMDIPCMSTHTYSKYHNNLGREWEKAAQKQMEEAVAQEIEEARKRGHIGSDGIPLLTVTADGSWAKRSYRNTHNSLSGVAAIVGYYSRKVLYFGMKNKFCITCSRAKNKGEEARTHLCGKNWEQSSSSMEAAIIVEGFMTSEAMYGVRYAKMVADGDSSVYKKILDARPYKTITVEKVECRNHLLRNYCNKIKDIVATSDNGQYPISLRKIISQKILKLRSAVTMAIRYRKNEIGPLDQRLDNLRKDILNGPYHVFGEHSGCAERGYFCDGDQTGNNIIPNLSISGLLEKIMTAVKYLVLNSRSLINDMDSNAVEQYNGVVAKFIGGKRINYSLKGSYNARCAGAVVQHNNGSSQYILHKYMYGRSPGTFCKRVQMRRKLQSITKKERRKTKPNVARPLFRNQKSENKDYGPNAQRPDMCKDEYIRESQIFLDALKKTDEERAILQKMTTLQRESGKWMEERRKLLTASNFGTVCKRRESTGCEKLVKKLLYGGSAPTQSMLYGINNEGNALRQLELEAKIQIKPAGLFVDSDIPFLGATPDGLIGQDGLVEVKCPSSASNMTPEEGIVEGKVQGLVLEDGNIVLNKKTQLFFSNSRPASYIKKKILFICHLDNERHKICKDRTR